MATTENHLPKSALISLEIMGANINVAIKRRKLKRKEVAESSGMSEPTLRLLINGDPKVGIDKLSSVLKELGLEDTLANVAKPVNDINPVSNQNPVSIIGINIGKAIKATKLRKYEFARNIGMTEQTLRTVVGGEGNYSLDRLATVLVAIGMIESLEKVASPTSDVVGNELSILDLPKIIRRKGR